MAPAFIWVVKVQALICAVNAGLLGFPKKDLQYLFLSLFLPAFYIRQREYSKVCCCSSLQLSNQDRHCLVSTLPLSPLLGCSSKLWQQGYLHNIAADTASLLACAHQAQSMCCNLLNCCIYGNAECSSCTIYHELCWSFVS